MRSARVVALVVATLLTTYQPANAQAAAASQPFKLGTFERNGQVFLGLVLQDSQVIDIAQANAAFESRNASAKKLSAPRDMKELISRYDREWKERLHSIAADNTARSAGYAFQYSALKALTPVQPALILNAAANYAEHALGIAQQQQRSGAAPEVSAPTAVAAPGIWERKAGDERENPYLFLKSATVVIGPTDPIRMPLGRDRIDFECEFATVIGKTAKHVAIDRAADYIFGYTIEIDVSDRGGRGDKKMGGSDWLVGKNHDTFAPLGPFIVPKEFVTNPMNLKQTFTLNGQVMQDSSTSRMTHNIYELLHYASNILRLNPGDLISNGSPAGTNIERTDPRWMRAGDTAVCTIEAIGTQTHSIVGSDTATSSR